MASQPIEMLEKGSSQCTDETEETHVYTSVGNHSASRNEETIMHQPRSNPTDISCNNPRSHSNMVAMSEVENDDPQNNRDMRDISTANDANRECEITLKDVMSRLDDITQTLGMVTRAGVTREARIREPKEEPREISVRQDHTWSCREGQAVHPR